MVTNEQIQRKIAEVLGWTDLHISDAHGSAGCLFGIDPIDGQNKKVPNWPTDRNASYDLPVEDAKALKVVSLIEPGPHSARQECLTWLKYKGWRWVENSWIQE